MPLSDRLPAGCPAAAFKHPIPLFRLDFILLDESETGLTACRLGAARRIRPDVAA
jgi:hypothetical protein